MLGYEELTEVITDIDRFTTNKQNAIPKFAFTGVRPPLHLDPPEHTSYRRVINRFFTPPKMRALEPAVRRGVVELLDPSLPRGPWTWRASTPTSCPPTYSRCSSTSRSTSAGDQMGQRDLRGRHPGAGRRTVKRLSGRRLYEIAQAIIDERRAGTLAADEDLTAGAAGGSAPRRAVAGRDGPRLRAAADRHRDGRAERVHRQHVRPPHPRPGAAGPPAGGSAAHSGSRRGVPPPLLPVPRHGPHRAPGTSWAGRRSRPTTRSRWSTPPPTATRGCSTTLIRSAEPAEHFPAHHLRPGHPHLSGRTAGPADVPHHAGGGPCPQPLHLTGDPEMAKWRSGD